MTGKYKLYENVYLIPHTTKGLETIGAANKMYIRDGRRWRPDDFAHEQSLVIEEEYGLIIFNSCSHGGADNIINEVSKLFEKPAKMMIGGFHIFQKGKLKFGSWQKNKGNRCKKDLYRSLYGRKSFSDSTAGVRRYGGAVKSWSRNRSIDISKEIKEVTGKESTDEKIQNHRYY